MKLLWTTLTALISTAAMAGEFLVIDMNDQHFRPRCNGTIPLKRKIKQQYPNINLQQAQIMSVVLVAKSKHGGGSAELKVGQSYSARQTLDGTPSQFRDSSQSSYDRVLFKNPKSNSKGVWQIKLNGNIIAHQAVVEIDPNATMKMPLFFDVHVRGQNTLKLKQKLRQQEGLIPADYDLKAITVIGKSKHGGGRVTLKVGQALSSAEILDGTPSQFHVEAGYTYDRVKIQNPKLNSNGVWQLQTQGNIKIKKIILHVQAK